ncbi:MAG: hypothetical protein J6568_02000 [Snodgrassella sp.]|nr:hypothetical protein [Snodgrassella sp.]
MSCSNKSFIENKQFNIISKNCKFKSDFCEYKNNDEKEVFFRTSYARSKAKNINRSYKNVIRIRAVLNIELEACNNKPVFHYFMPATESIEADIPIMFKNNDLLVQCVYITQRLKVFWKQNMLIMAINKLSKMVW